MRATLYVLTRTCLLLTIEINCITNTLCLSAPNKHIHIHIPGKQQCRDLNEGLGRRRRVVVEEMEIVMEEEMD